MRRALWAVITACVGAAAMAACAGGDDVAGETTDQVLGMPLSVECSACAQTALAGTCKAELLACNATPSCFDVNGCFEACAPNDVECFGQCAQASLPFSELADCVFCAECPAECANDWASCGGGTSGSSPCTTNAECGAQQVCTAGVCVAAPPGSACDGTGDCGACQQCVFSTGACNTQLAACQSTPDCMAVIECQQTCGVDPACPDACAQAHPGGAQLFAALGSCIVCEGCPADCLPNQVCPF